MTMQLYAKSPFAMIVWARIAVVTGLATCLVYPAIVFFPLPRLCLVVLAAFLGPLFGVISMGLGRFLQIPRSSVPAQIAVAFNFAAGALVSAMLLLQLAVKARPQGPAYSELVGIWLGLDVAFDVYIGLGTGLFALAMLRHPRFGIWLGVPGLVVSGLLLILNLYTFPTPPGDAGLVDIGPLVALWYLAVIIQVWRSLRWAESVLAAGIEESRPSGCHDTASFSAQDLKTGK